jgi:DNA repair protein SbcD/Mre11
MLILHTSDWHLGRSLHRADLRAAQGAFLDHLVEVVRAEQVDLVLVAGDVYDRAVPPVDAVELCEDALLRLHATGARIVLISGNHDSARRLGFGGGLLDKTGVHLRTRVGALARPVLLEDAHGPVAVYGIPYLEPEAVRDELPPDPANPDPANPDPASTDPASTDPANTDPANTDPANTGPANTGPANTGPANTGPGNQAGPPRGHRGVLGHAVRCIQADADARGVRRRVVLAHGWVTGGAACESERDITVGGVGQVPAEVFGGFSYAALGHLHGQQTLAPHLRYSGSPLPYSFSEATHHKGSWLVELDGAGTARAERVPAPGYRRLSVLRGRLAELLESGSCAQYEDDFLSVTLTDQSRPEGAMDALRARFPHVLVLMFEPEGTAPDSRGYRDRVAGRDDLAVAAEFVQHVRGAPATPDEQRLLAEAFQAVRTAEAG